MAFRVNEVVQLIGLQSNGLLNGSYATVRSFDGRRYQVQRADGTITGVKGSNLARPPPPAVEAVSRPPSTARHYPQRRQDTWGVKWDFLQGIWFYEGNPGAWWRRYVEPETNRFWWHSTAHQKWFYEDGEIPPPPPEVFLFRITLSAVASGGSTFPPKAAPTTCLKPVNVFQ